MRFSEEGEDGKEKGIDSKGLHCIVLHFIELEYNNNEGGDEKPSQSVN